MYSVNDCPNYGTNNQAREYSHFDRDFYDGQKYFHVILFISKMLLYIAKAAHVAPNIMLQALRLVAIC